MLKILKKKKKDGVLSDPCPGPCPQHLHQARLQSQYSIIHLAVCKPDLGKIRKINSAHSNPRTQARKQSSHWTVSYLNNALGCK